MRKNKLKEVDSYRFLDRAVKKLVRSWAWIEEPREIHWATLSKPLEDSTVGIITSAGLTLKTDQPWAAAEC